MTWWELTLTIIWGPTTVVGLVMIASVPVRAIWRRLPRTRLTHQPPVVVPEQIARDDHRLSGEIVRA